jgi:hypothetical protein
VIINGIGRFVLLEKPVAFPFTDIVNNTPDGPVFDLGVDLDMRDGVVYLKADHVEEMAKTLGMIHGEEVETLRNRIIELETKELPEEVKGLVDGINELVANYNNGAISSTASNELPDVPVPAIDGTKEDGDEYERSPESSGQKSGTSKRKGANELPSDSGDEFGFDL